MVKDTGYKQRHWSNGINEEPWGKMLGKSAGVMESGVTRTA